MLTIFVESATLRPVPLRPAGPIDPAEALAHVLAALPELDEPAARALALVEIAGRTRDEAGQETGLAPDVLGRALHRARKALRRSIFPLSASGWCERAERLLSERIDGVLAPPGPARLDVHLRNCERCVDHERRLSQGRERLVREFIDAHPESAGAGPAERSAGATLRVVETAVADAEPQPRYDGPTYVVAGFGGPIVERGDGSLPAPSFAGPGGPVAFVVEVRPERDPEVEPGDPTIEQDVAPAEPADATPSEDDAEAPAPPVDEPAAAVSVPAALVTPDEGISLVWGALTLLSVGISAFALIVIVLALSGADKVF